MDGPDDWLALVSRPPLDGRSPAFDMPTDLLVYLAKFLDFPSMCAVRATCHDFRAGVDSDFAKRYHPVLMVSFSTKGLEALDTFSASVFAAALPSIGFFAEGFHYKWKPYDSPGLALPRMTVADALVNLDSLSLSFQDYREREPQYPNFLQMIHSAPGLKVLALSGAGWDVDRVGVGINYLAKGIKLPMLQRLTIENLPVQVQPRKQLLLQHAGTLRRVKLDGCLKLDCQDEVSDFIRQHLTLDAGHPTIISDPGVFF